MREATEMSCWKTLPEFAAKPGAPRQLHRSSVWQWLVDNGPGVSAVAAALASIVAIVTLLRASMDSRARSRPVIIAEFRPDPESDSTFSLVIRNDGASLANRITVQFEPPLSVEAADESRIAKRLIKRFESSISHLAPGQELASVYALYGLASGSNEKVNLAKTPYDVNVTVEYSGVGRKRYREVYPLTSDTMTLNTFTYSSSSLRGRVEAIAMETKLQRESVQSIRHIPAKMGDVS